MIKLPVDNTPCKSFSVNTDVGVFRFRTYWNNLLSTWFIDIIGTDNQNVVSGIALLTGINNLVAGTGLDELKGCAMVVVDSSGNGNRTFDGFGKDALVYMTTGGEVYEPYG